jgi:N-methylhydantoinase A
VPAPAGKVGADYVARLADVFHATHKRLFGYDYAGEQRIEVVNFCVSGFGAIERPELPPLASMNSTPEPKETRPVWFGKGFLDTPVYDRATLPAGFNLSGPAVVEEFGSTSVVFPGQDLEVQDHGIMIITTRAEGVRS